MTAQIYWKGNLRVTKERFYSLNELSPEAQENAYQKHWLEGNFDYPWTRDNSDSLHEFCEVFGVTVRNWEYGGYRNPYVAFSVPEAWENELYGLFGIRLWKYLKANFSHILEDDSFPLTGYYMDEELLKPIRDFLKSPDGFTTMRDLVQDSMDAWAHACNEDFEHFYSEANFKENALESGWLFSEDGSEIEYDRDR